MLLSPKEEKVKCLCCCLYGPLDHLRLPRESELPSLNEITSAGIDDGVYCMPPLVIAAAAAVRMVSRIGGALFSQQFDRLPQLVKLVVLKGQGRTDKQIYRRIFIITRAGRQARAPQETSPFSRPWPSIVEVFESCSTGIVRTQTPRAPETYK